MSSVWGRRGVAAIAGMMVVYGVARVAVMTGSGSGAAEIANGLASFGGLIGGGMVAGAWLAGAVGVAVAVFLATYSAPTSATSNGDSEELVEANKTIVFLSDQLRDRDRTIARLKGVDEVPPL